MICKSCQTTPNTTLLICYIQCANRCTNGNKDIVFFRYFYGAAAPCPYCWMDIPKICIALKKGKAFTSAIIA